MRQLRSSVSVSNGDNSVDLQHGFWNLSFPSDWVASRPDLAAFLNGKCSFGQLEASDPKVQNVLALLDVTGCLTAEKRDQYSYAEVGLIIERMAIEWHALYYSHPLWDLLRNGSIGRNGFVAWVLHNYHLSRSAGATAARGAIRSPHAEIRHLFLESALEEYSHCEEYYCIDDDRLGVSNRDCRACIPLPSSLAIDQQMHRLAESDWLGHVMVGFFQESTASYFKKCCEFYSLVESNYGLPGFFESWKQHILLDLKYGHASAFKDAIDGMSGAVSLEALQHSLSEAAMTVHFLISALDEIVREDAFSRQVMLRAPIERLDVDFDSNPLLRRFRPVDWMQMGPVQSSINGVARVSECMIPKEESVPLSEWNAEEVSFLVSAIAFATLIALSHSQSHEEVVGLGKIVEYLQAMLGKPIEHSPYSSKSPRALAIANFLTEEARHPPGYCVTVLLLAKVLSFCSCEATLGLAKIIAVNLAGKIDAPEAESAVIWCRLYEFAAFPSSTTVSSDPFS